MTSRLLTATGTLVTIGLLTFGYADGAAAFTTSDSGVAGVDLEVGRSSDAETAAALAGPDGGLRAPGHVETVTYLVHNEGDLTGDLLVGLSTIEGIEDGCSSSAETKVDADCATDTTGDLLGQYLLEIRVAALPSNGDCTDAGAGTTLTAGTLDTLTIGAAATHVVLGSGEAVCVTAVGTFLDLPENNLAQGDDIDLALTITLEQR